MTVSSRTLAGVTLIRRKDRIGSFSNRLGNEIALGATANPRNSERRSQTPRTPTSNPAIPGNRGAWPRNRYTPRAIRRISPPISFQFQNRLDFGGVGAGAEGTSSFIVAVLGSWVAGLERRHDSAKFSTRKDCSARKCRPCSQAASCRRPKVSADARPRGVSSGQGVRCKPRPSQTAENVRGGVPIKANI